MKKTKYGIAVIRYCKDNGYFSVSMAESFKAGWLSALRALPVTADPFTIADLKLQANEPYEKVANNTEVQDTLSTTSVVPT